MPITTDDFRLYDDFLFAIVKDLGCLEPPPPDTLLWHYTNGGGLLGIVESGTLYSTQISCLNDSEEIKYASRLFKSALKKLSDDCPPDGSHSPIEAAAKYFDDDDEDYPGTLPYFVVCFTELEDAIAQWQGYGARGENGYAIGFLPGALTQMGGLLARVNYDAKKHEGLAIKVAKATFDFYQRGIEQKRAASPEEWAKEFLPVWDEKITQLAPLVKDPCWAHEKEYRIVRLLVQGQLPQLRMIQRDTMMTRHLPLRMTSDFQYPMLPIKEVVVGPCAHPSISRVSVDTLLRQHGYPGGIVRSSKRSYRKT